jgi:hypothetical protein
MDQNLGTSSPSPLFGLSIDEFSRNHLTEAAKWGKFLAIVGFVVCALIALSGIFVSSFISMMPEQAYETEQEKRISGYMATFLGIIYVLLAILYFFPCLFLYNFATKMKAALVSNNQDLLNISFQNLKKMLRYVGILTIIILSFYALIMIVVIVGATASSL